MFQDLQLCTDMATGVDSLGQFQFGDIVQIDPQTVGVIVQIQKENFQVTPWLYTPKLWKTLFHFFWKRVFFWAKQGGATALLVKVLNMHGKVVSMKPAALQKKRVHKDVKALDSEQNQIQVCWIHFSNGW